MDKVSRAMTEFREMDELAAMDSPVHRLHPLGKLLITVLYIALAVSVPKYDLSRLTVFILYPALGFALSGIRPGLCFYKLRIVLPLVCAVGLFNPLLDRAPLLRLGVLTVSGGTVSMLTLMLKGVLALCASFLLVGTTAMDAICAALRKLRVPSFMVTLLLLTYRYISLLMEQVGVMNEAYALRAPGQKGVHISAWGSFLGQLFLRSMDRAEELYAGMQLRGFRGEFPYADTAPWQSRDTLFLLAGSAALVLFRCVDVAGALGGLFG